MSEDGKLAVSQFLTFRLAEELFALNIDKVLEVMDYTTVTKVPRTPDYMSGVINLRGRVVPVVDLGLKFGKELAQQTVNTCIIIVEAEQGGEKIVIGARADAVQEVLDLEPDQIVPAPRIGTKLNLDYIQGMGRQGDQFIIILDIDQVFSDGEVLPVEELDDPVAVNG
jgi:purine-binding chemotaxis protein CheW